MREALQYQLKRENWDVCQVLMYFTFLSCWASRQLLIPQQWRLSPLVSQSHPTSTDVRAPVLLKLIMFPSSLQPLIMDLITAIEFY